MLGVEVLTAVEFQGLEEPSGDKGAPMLPVGLAHEALAVERPLRFSNNYPSRSNDSIAIGSYATRVRGIIVLVKYKKIHLLPYWAVNTRKHNQEKNQNTKQPPLVLFTKLAILLVVGYDL